MKTGPAAADAGKIFNKKILKEKQSKKIIKRKEDKWIFPGTEIMLTYL
jgi:hypothetical protein